MYKNYLIFITIFILQQLCFPKCPLDLYIFEGIIENEKIINDTNIFIENALVTVFLDNYQIGSFNISDIKGNYRILCPFNTFKWRPFFTDICGKKPKILVIFATAKGYYPRRKEFKIKNLTELKEKNAYKIPNITMMRKNKHIENFKQETEHLYK